MKQNWILLSRRYVTALRKHLHQGSLAGLPLARKVGRQAATFGLRALDLARIHEQALVTLGASSSQGRVRQRADAFFAAALTPLEQGGPSACQSTEQMRQLRDRLQQRTLELATAQGLLKQGIVARKALKADLREKAEHYAKLTKGSRAFQQALRNLTQQTLRAQEDERTTISRKLSDDIAQVLLGIQVRLAGLKQEAAVNRTGFKKEFASSQRLVEKSARALKRFADRLS